MQIGCDLVGSVRSPRDLAQLIPCEDKAGITWGSCAAQQAQTGAERMSAMSLWPEPTKPLCATLCVLQPCARVAGDLDHADRAARGALCLLALDDAGAAQLV